MEFKLIIKKTNNLLSLEEQKVFDKWYQESENHRSYFNRVKNFDSNSVEIADMEKSWKRLDKRLLSKEKKGINLWQKLRVWKYAVTVAILILAASPFIFDHFEANDEELKLNASNIKPGVDKALLTLEDGKHIRLEEGSPYSFEDGISGGKSLIYHRKNIVEREIIKYNYLTIPRGGQYFVILSDGTKVWLNSDSKLKYPVRFKEGQAREVELVYGEAYFDVSHSENHNGAKFKMHTQSQTIEVLGTEFNVKAYRNENKLYTTLVEGKVSISNSTSKQFLNPGQQSTIKSNSTKINVADIDVANEIAWKNGFFSFEKEPLDKILRILSRWYDVDVNYKNEDKKNLIFSGVLKRAKTIEDLLINFQKIGRVKFLVDGKKITVK